MNGRVVEPLKHDHTNGAMVNGPAMGSMGRLACSVIQSRAHFMVSARDLAALTHSLRWRTPPKEPECSRRVFFVRGVGARSLETDKRRRKKKERSCLNSLSYETTETAL